jgi:hypothetical protein
MAGSINLSLSQQFDKLNGNLLSGGRLYFYAAGTDSPQNAYKDDGLTLVHPNPIILASDGRIPQLYFADGSIHVRLTSAGGVVQFDEDFVLVIGPSSGGGGGGGSSVDPNAIFQTGDMMWQPTGGARSGWVQSNGNTIGNSSSGATERGNSDCLQLFEYLYNKYPDVYCPVSGGRTVGGAAIDFGNNKNIKLLDMREIIAGGLSTMGHNPASGGAADRGGYAAISPIATDFGDRNTPASVIGEIIHRLVEVEVPSHSHGGGGTTASNSVDHTHDGGGLFDAYDTQIVHGSSGGAALATVPNTINASGSASTGGESTSHTHTYTIPSFGGDSTHNNTPRIMVGTFYQRL